MTPDLKNDNLNTPPIPVSHESYIVGASPTGAWSGLAGHIVYWNGSAWVDILNRAVQAGDRFGVLLEEITQTAGGGLTGKDQTVVEIVNATPGSITYSITPPTLGMTVFDSGAPDDGDYGDGYNYNGTYWNQFISSTGYTAGDGLTLTGNSFSIGLGQVSNTMLAGSVAASKLIGTDIATVGTITSGTWNGTPVGDNWISSASAWNSKLSSVSNLAGTGIPVYKTTSSNDAKFKRLVAGPGMSITDNTDSITIGTTGLISIDTSDISNFYLKVRRELSAGTGISYNNSTGVITNSGVTSLNGNTGVLILDTNYIANFSTKIRSLFSGTTPITYANGLIGITQASSSANGYLSSADWNLFSNKVTSQWITSGNNIYYNSGNVGIGTSTFDGASPERLIVDAGATGNTDYQNVIVGKGNTDSYAQLNIQNLSNGTSASSDVVATADNGSETTNFVDVGINSSGYTGGVMGGANDAYLYNVGGNLLIGASSFSSSLVFVTGGLTQSSNERMRIDSAGRVGIGIINPSAILHLHAGTAAAKTAPLKFTAGTNLSITEAGAIEYNGSHLYFTATNGGTRYQLDQQPVDTSSIANFSAKVRSLFSRTAPITYSNGLIGISLATTSTSGYLSSTDWNKFNSKANSFTNGNLIETGSGVLTITGGTGSVIGTGTSIQVKQATASQSGFLSNADWNTFNSKLSSIDTTNISSFSVKVRSLFSAIAPITYSNGLIGITQATTSTNGYLSSADWNTFNNKLSSIDTSSIANFSAKVRSLFSGTAPITFSNGLIGITQASTSTNGYLNSSDWNTFNNKLSSIDTTNISNFSAKVRSLFSGTAPITFSNGLIGITQASTSTNGYLSSADWNTFNIKASSSNVWLLSGNTGTNSSTNFLGTTDNQDLVFKTNNTETARIISSTGDIKIGSTTTGTIRSTQELVLRQDGDTYGSSILRLRNRTAENGAIFETTDPSVTLVDFIFKTAASQRNIRYEARSTSAKTGTPSFHIGGSNPDNPTLAVGDNYAAFNTNLKIGNYNTPTEALDVTGNVRFSGALMPNNGSGTSGQVLSSGGSGVAPTWINFNLSGLKDVSLSSPINGQLLQYNGTRWINTTSPYLTSVDTTNISNFYLKVRSLFSAGSGVSYNSTTGVISSTVTGNNFWALGGNTIGVMKNFGSTDNYNVGFITNNAERMRIDNLGRIGIGVTDPANPLVVKDTLEIRRTGTMSELLFTNTAGSGDFRIGGDGGDIFWQGGGGRNLQMGSYWTTVLTGDRQNPSFPSYMNGTANTGVLIPAQRDASVPLAIQSNSSSQTANLTEWRNSSGTVLDVVDKNGNIGIGTSSFDATNPEKLLIDAGTTSSYNLINAQGSINNYLQFNIQNNSSGATASSDIVATANNGTETVNYVDLGINSSGFSNTGIIGGADNAYLYSTGNDFVIGNGTSSKSLRFFTGGTNTTNERMRIDGNGKVGLSTTSPQATLDVNGNYKLGSSGTVLSNMIKTTFSISDFTSFDYNSTRQITVSVPGATVNGTVILNPRSALPTGLGIGWAMVSSTSNITIGFTNTGNARSIGNVTFDVTIIQ